MAARGLERAVLGTGGLQPEYEASQTSCWMPQSAVAFNTSTLARPLTSGVIRLQSVVGPERVLHHHGVVLGQLVCSFVRSPR